MISWMVIDSDGNQCEKWKEFVFSSYLICWFTIIICLTLSIYSDDGALDVYLHTFSLSKGFIQLM